MEKRNMVIRILFCLLALMPFTATTTVEAGWFDTFMGYFKRSGPTAPPKIKVLIVHDEVGVVLEVKGKYKILDPHTFEHLSTRYTGKRKFIQAVRDGIKWGEEFPGVYQILIVPDEASTTTVVDGIEYRGPIYVYDIGGTISVVNEILIEDFLASTLSTRYREEGPDEALAAAAIVARTAAYYRIENPKSQYWSLDGRQAGYQGYASVNPQSAIDKAIRATRYMVMSNGAPNSGQTVPFLASWKPSSPTNISAQEIVGRITFSEAEDFAKKGENAAQILARAYPGVKIDLIHYAEVAPKK